MKLDNFQLLIKDRFLDIDLNAVEAKVFVQNLAGAYEDQFQYIQDNVELAVDFADRFTNSINQTESHSIQAMDNAIKLHVNLLIKATVEEIEDIEEYNKAEVEPEDCMDIYKRSEELRQ